MPTCWRSAACCCSAGAWATPYLLLAVGIAGARLGFVAQYGTASLDAPLSIFDIRDGGWSPAVGLLAAALMAGALAIRRRAVTLPMAAGIGVATTVWLTATLGLTLMERPRQELPTVAVFRLDGTSTSLEQFNGKPLVVNLWAT